MPIGPVDTCAAFALAEAIAGRAALILNFANRCTHAGGDGNDVQAGTHQHVVAVDLWFAKLDTAGDDRVVAKAHHQANSVGSLGARQRKADSTDGQSQQYDQRQVKAACFAFHIASTKKEVPARPLTAPEPDLWERLVVLADYWQVDNVWFQCAA